MWHTSDWDAWARITNNKMGMDRCTKQGGTAHASNSDIETKIWISYSEPVVAGLRLKLVWSLDDCTKHFAFIGRVVVCFPFLMPCNLFILVPFNWLHTSTVSHQNIMQAQGQLWWSHLCWSWRIFCFSFVFLFSFFFFFFAPWKVLNDEKGETWKNLLDLRIWLM